MSLVGTRPPTMDEWEKYELHHRKRLAIKPGLRLYNSVWRFASFNELIKITFATVIMDV